MSLAAWIGQRRLQRESNDLQRATAELARKQLEILLREDIGKSNARLLLEIIKENKSFYFILKNISDVEATDIELKPILQRPEDNPFIASEYQEKFPLKKLQPSGSIRLHAAIYLSSPSSFNISISWKNPDGRQIQEESFVSL
ncbi:MAG: hypothetical protein CTY10_02540 [Methylotenera sp.]|nr:MAG: hypothetical protein CTY10_02540 [Methylotenera sp.]